MIDGKDIVHALGDPADHQTDALLVPEFLKAQKVHILAQPRKMLPGGLPAAAALIQHHDPGSRGAAVFRNGI